MRSFVAAVRKVLPDIATSVDEVIAESDMVGVQVTLRGTSTMVGRRVTFLEVQIYRFAGGKIPERWFVVDRSDLQPAPPVALDWRPRQGVP
jgi:predicted ester cyclase